MANDADQQDEWDYVVVGGGSAGCVLANRLSANPGTRVLLLEAGGWDRDLRIRIPAGMARLPKDLDWQYEAQPDPSRNDKVDTWAAGKVLGGGSSINMMLWVRGEPSDFDSWRDQGCEGWGYDDVLPYFKRAETFTDEKSPVRGDRGPIGVARVSTPLEVIDDFLAAGVEAGHALNPDYNGERQQGVALAQVSQRRGFRSSTARGYLAPVRKRPNLTVRTEAHATRVRMEGQRAVGVEYLHEGQSLFASATREVILSAGAIISPKLLMLSGIGPADHLREHGIEVRKDAPGVGANLQDHAFGLMMYKTTAGTLTEELKPWRAVKHFFNYVFRGKGAITFSGGAAVVFSKTSGPRPTETEIILMPLGMSFKAKAGGNSTEHDIHDVKIERHGVMLYPSYVHPTARGTVRLASADPTARPVLDHQLLSGDDMAALIAACREARAIFQTPRMKSKQVVEGLPGDAVQTDEQWAEYLRGHSFRPYHPCGTCRMGADDGAVVDPQLRVRGVEGLRVVDASIFPTVTSGNTNAPVIMVAEKAADLILKGGAK